MRSGYFERTDLRKRRMARLTASACSMKKPWPPGSRARRARRMRFASALAKAGGVRMSSLPTSTSVGAAGAARPLAPAPVPAAGAGGAEALRERPREGGRRQDVVLADEHERRHADRRQALRPRAVPGEDAAALPLDRLRLGLVRIRDRTLEGDLDVL